LSRPVILIMLVALSQFRCQVADQPAEIRPARVLFLGHDSEHHNAKAYLPILQAALAPKGFYFTYTADPDDLTDEVLKDYDALMLYANHDAITEEQAKALLTYVRRGGGFVPVHSASYCFRNSEEIVK